MVYSLLAIYCCLLRGYRRDSSFKRREDFGARIFSLNVLKSCIGEKPSHFSTALPQ